MQKLVELFDMAVSDEIGPIISLYLACLLLGIAFIISFLADEKFNQKQFWQVAIFVIVAAPILWPLLVVGVPICLMTIFSIIIIDKTGLLMAYAMKGIRTIK